MDQAAYVKTVLTTTADDFLAAIAPNGPRYGGSYHPHGLYFRGHANSEWLLLPSVLRENVFLDVGGWSKGPRTENGAQIEREARLLSKFAELANQSGLFVPESAILLLQRFESVDRYFSNREVQWPPDELLPIAALAQHSRLPTRLLDWTRDSYVAAYFAATEAATWLFKTNADLRKNAKHLCVWVIHETLFSVGEIVKGTPPRISPIITSYATNANMRAQKGLFLIDRPSELDLSAAVDSRPWNKLIQEDADWYSAPDPNSNFGMLDRICLPIEEAPRLLRLLSHQGVSAASVFPNYDGVVSAIGERKYWESSEEFARRERSRESP
jgi:hypothetical protein